MESNYQFLLTVGGILLLGLLTSTIGRRSPLPRVTLLLMFGVCIGSDGFDIIPSVFVDWFELIANMALLMVGFLLGGQLTRKHLASATSEVFWFSVVAALVTALLVCGALVLVGAPLALAILLGCIAAATDAAAVLDVVTEFGRKTRFGRILLAVVALDDVWALVLFSTGAALVASMAGAEGGESFLAAAGWEIGGALLLGVAIGLPGAYLTGRVRKGEPILTEAMGLVLVCGGIALWLEVSYLIAAMVMGAVITNLARHHKHPFHAIEGIEQPFLMIFFVLAGASLELDAVYGLGLLGLAYLASRVAGKFIGAWLGGLAAGASSHTRRWMGPALLPQAGVAIGMALVAANEFPEHRQLLLSLAISSTVVFEIAGPIFTRLAMARVCKIEAEALATPGGATPEQAKQRGERP